MGLLWIENMRRRERSARAQRLALQPREDLLRRPDEIATSREASAAGPPSPGEPSDASPDAEARS